MRDLPIINAPFSPNRQSRQWNDLAAWWVPAASRRGGMIVREPVAGRDMVFNDINPAKVDWDKTPSVYFPLSVRTMSGPYGATGATGLNVSAPFSLVVWTIPTTSDTYGKIIVKPHTNPATTPYILAHLGSVSGKFAFGISPGSGNSTDITDSASWASGTQYLIVGTYDGATMLLYVNGALVAQTNVALTVGSNGMPWRMGFSGSATNMYYGHIQDVRIYRRALSPADINHLYSPLTRLELYKPQYQRGISGAGTSTPPAPGGSAFGPRWQVS